MGAISFLEALHQLETGVLSWNADMEHESADGKSGCVDAVSSTVRARVEGGGSNDKATRASLKALLSLPDYSEEIAQFIAWGNETKEILSPCNESRRTSTPPFIKIKLLAHTTYQGAIEGGVSYHPPKSRVPRAMFGSNLQVKNGTLSERSTRNFMSTQEGCCKKVKRKSMLRSL